MLLSCRSQRLLLIVGLISCLLSAIVLADSAPSKWDDEDRSYDRARRAVEAGSALELPHILKHLRRYAGDDEIVALEYEHEFGLWVYEFKVVDKTGRLRMLHINAANGDLVDERDEFDRAN